ncbi:MAG: septum formation inhibitor Maf [Ruminococcaceae bacterium]|nr:septum formation inhibitor Maf [Oscillospiraceae bacterium]
MGNPLFVLASKSPRRRELLKKIGVQAELMTANVDESVIKNLPPENTVTELALLKATDVAKYFCGDTYVIGADTVVCVDGEILGKPKNIDEAKRMLRKLSGRSHFVYTGYCVVHCKSGVAVSKYEKTEVFFKELSDKEIDAYVKTREPMDKAGAYGIQEKGSLFIEKINGDYFNVVGLPVCALAKLFKEEFEINLL